MSEAYLMTTDFDYIKGLINSLNSYTNYVNIKFDTAISSEDDVPLGRVAWSSDEGEYVFYPSTGYAKYQPTDRGE